VSEGNAVFIESEKVSFCHVGTFLGSWLISKRPKFDQFYPSFLTDSIAAILS
jgi:hypothetical protein